MSVWRHELRHLDPALVEQVKATRNAEAKLLVNRVDKIVSRLERRAEEIDDTHQLEVMLKLVRELRPYQELYGRASKQLSNDKVEALLITLGVRTEAEAVERLSLSRGGEDLTPDQAQSEALETLRLAWLKEPGLRYSALAEMKRWSFAEEVPALTNGTNGHQD